MTGVFHGFSLSLQVNYKILPFEPMRSFHFTSRKVCHTQVSYLPLLHDLGIWSSVVK